MPRVDLKHIPVRPANPFAGWERKAHRTLFALFLASSLVVWVNLWISRPWFGGRYWLEGCLWIVTAATTLASFCRQLPAQNVIFGAALIGVCGGGVQAINGMAGVPFGPLEYHRDNIGQFLIDPLPWPLPLIWVIAILNSRGVARLILRSRRRASYYGFWVMGLTVALLVVFQLSFQPYATRVKEFWTWKPTKLLSSWYGAPWTNFLGSAVTTLLILLFITPLLINKSPVQKPVAWHSLLVWEILSLLFLTGTAIRHLSGASIFTVAQMLVIAILCLLGTRARHGSGSTPPSVSSASTT